MHQALAGNTPDWVELLAAGRRRRHVGGRPDRQRQPRGARRRCSRHNGRAWVATSHANHEVTVGVEDGRGGKASQTFTLTAAAGTANRPPTISSSPRTGARLGSRYLYAVEAADPDGDPLTYRSTRPRPA